MAARAQPLPPPLPSQRRASLCGRADPRVPILSGIPSTVVISASFDDVIAITGYAVFSHIAITGQGNIGWPIAQGPMQVVFGIVGGLLIGIALSYTRIFDTLIKRIVGMYGGSASEIPARGGAGEGRVCGFRCASRQGAGRGGSGGRGRLRIPTASRRRRRWRLRLARRGRWPTRRP